METLTTIGLMSGTSMDGIDAALVRTDGETVAGFGPALGVAYEEGFRERLRAVMDVHPDRNPEADAVARDLTLLHALAVARLLDQAGLNAAGIDVVGFHGQTVLHRPEKGVTRQIGDGALLARETGIAVVSDFRAADVAAGGQGAPLAALYHAALAEPLEKPLAVLNVGGVANITWISPDGGVIAFDAGPGNALLDDWSRTRAGEPMDRDGRLAREGAVAGDALEKLLDHPYFQKPYPKSLDRGDFTADTLQHLSDADGAATLAAFTAASVEKAAEILPAPPARWIVTGGGRRNPAIMAALRRVLDEPVEPAEMAGWQGDALEAQAFGFLAARSLGGLPLSLPSTTGCKRPTTGGVLHRPEGRG